MNQQKKEGIRDGSGHPGSWCVSVFWHQLGTKKQRASPLARTSPACPTLLLNEDERHQSGHTAQPAGDDGLQGTVKRNGSLNAGCPIADDDGEH